jgi:hypothetical protein
MRVHRRRKDPCPCRPGCSPAGRWRKDADLLGRIGVAPGDIDGGGHAPATPGARPTSRFCVATRSASKGAERGRGRWQRPADGTAPSRCHAGGRCNWSFQGPASPREHSNVTNYPWMSTDDERGCLLELMGGFRGVAQKSIDKNQSPDRVSAGQGLCRVGTAGFEPTTP